VEHPFANLKYRIFGHPRFLLRGLRGAQTEPGGSRLQPETHAEHPRRKLVKNSSTNSLNPPAKTATSIIMSVRHLTKQKSDAPELGTPLQSAYRRSFRNSLQPSGLFILYYL
jgi:hypothetical protein